MNNLDKTYTDLLQDILKNGVIKKDRTGTGTISVFGRQIRHKMSEGFPLLTTKKMFFKGIVTELIWFLRGDTNIKYLVDNGCHIWDGDAYKNYEKKHKKIVDGVDTSNGGDVFYIPDETTQYGRVRPFTKEEFIDKIKTDEDFAKKWGELGPVYGKQWRDWGGHSILIEKGGYHYGGSFGGPTHHVGGVLTKDYIHGVDQLGNVIAKLKSNPDDRRMMVTAWNPDEVDQCVLPPCHYGFQVYTRELTQTERLKIYHDKYTDGVIINKEGGDWVEAKLTTRNIPTRAISMMWNQRSVDTFLGLPFNIASYGLLLEILGKITNMVPDELIGNLGDTHLYLNHIDAAKEQIGREMRLQERTDYGVDVLGYNGLLDFGQTQNDDDKILFCLNNWFVPTKTREPFELPTISIKESDDLLATLKTEDIVLEGYKSHGKIEAALSN